MSKKHDFFLLGATIILSIIGLFTLLSTNIQLDGTLDWGGVVRKQLVFLGIGFLLYIVTWLVDYSFLRYYQIVAIFYLATLILLLITLFFAPVINNVKRWLVIGGFQIQPSEIAKVAVILMTASIMSMKDRYNEWLLLAISFAATIPAVVLVYLEPHGSMSLMIFLIWSVTAFTFLKNQLRNFLILGIIGASSIGFLLFALKFELLGVVSLVVAGALFIIGFYLREYWRKLFVLDLVGGIVAGFFGYFGWDRLLKDYQRERIETFLNPEENEQDEAFNVRQSKIAIGSGGLLGKGFGYGTQSRLNFLPEHQTDFIFATYAEQFGLLGSLFLLAVYGFMISRVLYLGMQNSDDMFASIVCIGIGFKLLVEVFINIGTNTGIIPATGVPLPLISSGGSMTIMTLFSLGLIQSIISHKEYQPDAELLVDNDELLI